MLNHLKSENMFIQTVEGKFLYVTDAVTDTLFAVCIRNRMLGTSRNTGWETKNLHGG